MMHYHAHWMTDEACRTQTEHVVEWQEEIFFFFLMDIGTDHQALEENGLQKCPYKSLLKKEPKIVSVKPK